MKSVCRLRIPALLGVATTVLLCSCHGPETSGFRSDNDSETSGFRDDVLDVDRLREKGLSFDDVSPTPESADEEVGRTEGKRDEVSSRGELESRGPSTDRGPRSTKKRYAPEIERILEGFSKSSASADAAFRSLSFIDPALIPECLNLVTSSEPTRLERIRVVVPDKDFVRHAKPFLVSDIRGMGVMEEFDDEGQPVNIFYTKKSYNVDRRGRGYVVTVDNFRGFPLGVAVRAALLNRIQSRRYPRGIDHRRHLRSWWYAYFRNVKRAMEQNRR